MERHQQSPESLHEAQTLKIRQKCKEFLVQDFFVLGNSRQGLGLVFSIVSHKGFQVPFAYLDFPVTEFGRGLCTVPLVEAVVESAVAGTWEQLAQLYAVTSDF